jgi:hypothetical protein
VQASRRSGARRINEFLSLFDVPVAEVMHDAAAGRSWKTMFGASA